jgi:anthranilate synthase
MTSSYEYPGRYTRWTVGFAAPALQIEGRGFDFKIMALNGRGLVLLALIREHLNKFNEEFSIESESIEDTIKGSIVQSSSNYFAEENRSKQPSLFSVVRVVKDLFASPDAGQLGLYGAMGYDLTFQFESIQLSAERDADQRDLVMYLPDEILIVDNQKKGAWKIKYEFSDIDNAGKILSTTAGLPRIAAISPYVPADANAKFSPRDGPKGKYAETVVKAKEEFRVGNLFEVVLSQAFREVLKVKPSIIFRR